MPQHSDRFPTGKLLYLNINIKVIELTELSIELQMKQDNKRDIDIAS